MSEAVKVTISLPRDLLEVVEREREQTHESRSEFFRQALETLIRARCERAAEEQYVRGYREQPETDAEVAATWALSAAALAGEPWE